MRSSQPRLFVLYVRRPYCPCGQSYARCPLVCCAITDTLHILSSSVVLSLPRLCRADDLYFGITRFFRLISLALHCLRHLRLA